MEFTIGLVIDVVFITCYIAFFIEACMSFELSLESLAIGRDTATN